MELKKLKTFDLRKNSLIYILLGLNLVLGMILLSFSGITKDLDKPQTEDDDFVEIVDVIPIIDIDDSTPPPPIVDNEPPPIPPEIPEEIEETPVEDEPIKIEEKVEQKVDAVKADFAKSQPTKSKPKPPVKIEKPKEEEVSRAKTVSPRKVEIMAVYPGCERDRAVKKAKKSGDKKAEKDALIKCFSRKLGEEISYTMDEEKLSNYADDNSKSLLKAKLSFIVDTEGRITSIKASSKGDKKLSPEAVSALKKISKKLTRNRNGGIKPGQYEDGEKVNITYSIPVKFQFQRN